MFGKKKKDNKLTVEIVTYNQGQSTEHFGLAAVEKEGKRKETRPLQAAPKWKTKAGAARWAKKNGYNLNDIKELSKDIPTKPKKDTEKEAKAKLAGEVYDLMKLNHTPEQRKRLPSRESYIQGQFKPVIIGGRNFGTATMKELEDAKAELLQKFSQKKAEKPVAKRSESKPAQAAVSSIKVGDKIVGKVNGAVGVVKEIKQDKLGTESGRTRTSKPYAVIEWQNAKKSQRQTTGISLDNLKRLEVTGGISIETPKKTEKAPSKKSTGTKPAAKPITTKKSKKK